MIMYVTTGESGTLLLRPESVLYSLFCGGLKHQIGRGELFKNVYYIKDADDVSCVLKDVKVVVISSALVPYVGYGNNALSQSWFNNFLTWLRKTKATGVKFYMLRDSRSVAWKCIEPELLSATFGQNELYTTVSSELRFEQVDIQRIVEYEIEYTMKKETEIKKPEKKLKKRR